MTSLELPVFTCTEEALEFGRYITRDQFLLLSGARAALQREFRELSGEPGVRWKIERQIALACKIQLLREALEAAPDLILCSLLPRATACLPRATRIPEDTIARDPFYPDHDAIPHPADAALNAHPLE